MIDTAVTLIAAVNSLHENGIKNVISNSGTALTERQMSTIWKFFSNPVICLDGDQSGQNAALRIAQRLFPIINDENKIYFSAILLNSILVFPLRYSSSFFELKN